MNTHTRSRILRTVVAALAISVIIQPHSAPAQKPRDHGTHREKRMAELERLKQVRLVEELDLGEEEAVRLVARQRTHREKMQELSKKKNETLDGMAVALDSGRTSGLPAAFESVEAAERQMADERGRFDREIRSLLSEPQYARYLLFERKFQHDVRDAVGKAMKRRLKR